MTAELLDAALKYASYGWRVFPLMPRDKKPATSNGVHAATTDPDQIRAWWADNPEYNIGLACGSSGVVAVDLDAPQAQGSLEEQYGPLPQTATVRTREGRRHLLYQTPAYPFPNTVKRIDRDVDTRGEGGYIVLPPSIHPDTGERYEWLSKEAPAELPGWMSEALAKPRKEQPPAATSVATPYGHAVLNGELARLVRAGEGTRNATLFHVAVRVFELVKAGQIDHREAVDAVERAARSTGLDQDEIERTMQSSWSRAEARPPEPLEKEEDYHQRESSEGAFLTLDDLRAIPAPRWLVPNAVPEGMTLLYGTRNLGKTFVALDMALSLASNGELVVYCAGEGVSGLSSRVDAWALAHPDLDPSSHFLVRANRFFPKLLRPDSVQRLMAGFHTLEREGRIPKLIVIDTWRRALAGETTSSDESTGKAIDVLDTIRDRWGTSALIIHHPRKPSKEDRNPPEAGSGALGDNVDYVLHLSGDPEGLNRTLWNEKAKDFEKQPPLSFRLHAVGSSLVVSPSVSEQMGSANALQ